ncbi:MAG: hypothetical protein KI792_03570 [Alphaproteobacteria bacterium]|nr:hypothetical protein [Alphaproteobacteria bacterium SS10]
MISDDDGKDAGSDDLVQFLPASRALQKKSGGPSGKFGDQKIEAAQDQINARADAFMTEMANELDALKAAYDKVKDAKNPDAKSLERIAMTAREIKGVAGTFGFDLLTSVSDSLYEFASDLPGLTQRRADLIGAHIDAIEVVITNRITGDGGAIAEGLLETLGIATDKLGAPKD